MEILHKCNPLLILSIFFLLQFFSAPHHIRNDKNCGLHLGLFYMVDKQEKHQTGNAIEELKMIAKIIFKKCSWNTNTLFLILHRLWCKNHHIPTIVEDQLWEKKLFTYKNLVFHSQLFHSGYFLSSTGSFQASRLFWHTWILLHTDQKLSLSLSKLWSKSEKM